MDLFSIKNNRLIRIAAISGLFYALVLILGRQIYLYNGFERAFSTPSATIVTILLIILIATVTTAALYFFFKWFLIITSEDADFQKKVITGTIKGSHIKAWAITWLVLFVCWLPCYLAYYPGVLSYDMPEQINIIEGIFPATTHQPPIHTMLFSWCMSLGKLTGIEPIVIYTVPQIIIVAAVFAYMIQFIVKHLLRKKWEVILLYLFFTINPVMPMMAMEPTKDVYFTCFFIGITIFIYKLVINSTKLKMYEYVLFSINVLFAMLFRNNTLYVMVLVVLIIILLVKISKKIKLYLTVSTLIALIVFKFITGPIYEKYDIKVLDDKVEMSAVPVQQLALVILEDGQNFTEEDWIEITEFIYDVPLLKEQYNPRLYDPAKDALYKTNLQENYGKFLKLWAKYLKKYPEKYVRAFLNLNIPFWYPLASTVDPFSDRFYIETDIGICAYQFERDSKIPFLMDFYEKIGDFSALDKPIIRVLFGINTPIWVMLIGILLLLVKKDYKKIIVFMPALLLWATYLLGPVSYFRYVYPNFVLYALFIAIVLHKDVEENEDI